MTKNPITIQKWKKISEVNAIFHEHNIHHIPVLDHKKPVDIIAQVDLFRLIYDTDKIDNRMQDTMIDKLHTISNIMTKNLKTLSISSTVRDAAELLSDSHYNSVIVLENDVLAGIVTTTDLIRYLSEQF